MKVAIVGGGAAGFFAAFSVKYHHPEAEVTILEKSSKLLSKVKVSGGGRCNVTHDCLLANQLVKKYPRGEKFLKKAFSKFSVPDTISWFSERGVKLRAEEDGRIFPTTNSSQTIIDCFMLEVQRLKIGIELKVGITQMVPQGTAIALLVNGQRRSFTHVIVCTGGSPKVEGFRWLHDIGHNIVPPVPSLFTFNMPNEPITKLMGLAIANVTVSVQGTKIKHTGALLITHWGMSGPAILKTSAWAARVLADMGYRFNIKINWCGSLNEATIKTQIEVIKKTMPKRKLANHRMESIPKRLWLFLLDKLSFREDITWGELGSKGVNKLVDLLINDIYYVERKTTFKEEFVTCGGINLSEISPYTMKSKIIPNLYFAGEVMDIDGITGGFNFQSAWTTGYIAGQLLN